MASDWSAGSGGQQTDLSSSTAGGPRWVLDGEVFNCQMCGVKFDMLKRKHHCRRCGGVFCKACTPHRRLLPEGSMITVGGIAAKLNPRNPQRVCRTCQAELDPLQSQLCVSIGNSIKENNANKEGTKSHTAAFTEGFTLGAEIRKASYTVKNFCKNGMPKTKRGPFMRESTADLAIRKPGSQAPFS